MKPHLLAFLALAFLPTVFAAAPRSPNILLILADDLGTPPVASYGNSWYQTPHLDRLTREGLRF
ncbi:MAG: sulfatase-like hydrolase/transferase, partial [Verrucomicrobiota bacterium]